MRQGVEGEQGEEAKISTRKHQEDKLRRSQFCKLVEACKRKDLATIQQLIGSHPELLNHHDKHHRNLLHYTAILVLESDKHQQEPDAPATGKFAESAAAASLDCFRYLLGRCEPRLCTERDLDGLTVLHLAVISCNVNLVREILPPAGPEKLKAASEDCQLSTLAAVLDKEHHGPLHWAVITNNLECVKILIEHPSGGGVQLAHQPDLNGATPLHYATQTSDYPKYRAQLRQMLKLATQSSRSSTSQPSAGDSSSATPSPLSSCDSSLGQVNKQQQEQQTSERNNRKKLVRYETTTREPGTSSLSFDRPGSCVTQRAAAAAGNLDILRYLVQLPGVKLECRDRDSRTPLLWAASSGNRQAILLLLQSGADSLCQDANKLGPLHCAASHGYTDCLECFLSGAGPSAEASINQPDNLSCTPLFYAVLSGNIDCVELLLDRGARHDWQDVRGRTAAHFAALKGQLNTLKLLDARGANLWLANKQGDLPLHYAIKSGRQQVVAWLLEHSPYERAVNAINNTGRAPIHLALLKPLNGSTMVEFLIGQGANLNQLVKVRDSRTASTSGGGAAPSYRYETALDMAKRLNLRDCLELLERNSAKSAAWVLARREHPTSVDSARGGPNKSLFDVQAEEVAASPIGFETSGSSAEPPHSVSEPSEAPPTRLPAARPPPLVESAAPQLSDSTNSSALSQSSLTSVRGARVMGGEAREEEEAPRESAQASRGAEKQQSAAAAARRPYRGGINYHNDRINASIKCKLYENCGHQSFPPSSEPNRKHDATRRAGQRHSVGSLANERAGGQQQQEIITNVNVYTTSPNCPHCIDHHEQSQECALIGQRRAGDIASDGRRRSSGPTTARHHQQQHEFSETTSDTSDATSEIIYDDEDSDREQRAYLPPPPPLAGEGPTAEKGASSPAQSQQQHVRYLPPSQAYTQHLPVILSAEEERSTSGDTCNTGRHESESVSPGDVDNPTAGVDQAETQRAHRAHTKRAQVDDRYQVPSPVAEYIRRNHVASDRHHHHQRALSMGPQRSDVRGWSQQQQQHDPRARVVDYSQVRAKVDSHRNDSGLSMSHYGDDLAPLDGTGSSVGRRSKSWSTLDSRTGHRGQPPAPAHQTSGDYSPSPIGGANEDARSCSRQTIIRTRRLSVDSVELATSVEKSIRKYKQENKLFEELQNLKRSQIRSGRANEALLVKRLVERFRHEIQRDTLMALDVYHGPYTYQAYELYLYDQLGKVSHSNRAKLAAGARVPHKFTYQEQSGGAVPLGSSQPAATAATPTYDTRDFFEEDLKAELELQRVIQRSEIALREGPQVAGARAQTDGVDIDQSDLVVIEPSGALEDIRVRDNRASPSEEVSSEQQQQVQDDQLDDATASKVDMHEKQGEEPTSPHAGRPFAGSSTASSRRSSVEVEREKLENLPLRLSDLDQQQQQDDESERAELSLLADEKERRQIEAQARDLTAAIITDALGNVSRASSPVGQRRRVADEDEDGSGDGQQAVQSEANSLDETTAKEAASETRQQDDTQRATMHGRRRSVVNIGNKMEIIYHNVGIEIDTVGENPPSDDDDDVKSAPADDKATPNGGEVPMNKTETADQAAKLEKVHEHDEEEEEVESVLDDSSSQNQEQELPSTRRRKSNESKTDDENETQEERPADIAEIPAESAIEQENEEDERQSESMAHTPSSSIVALEPAELNSRLNAALDRPSATFSRRASSPPGAQGSGGNKRAAVGRRMSVDSSHYQQQPSTSDMIVVQRKVFNGFDLDSLHAHRRKHLAREQSDTSTTNEQQQTGPKVRQAGWTPQAKFKLRLPRSRPPAGPYQVHVPTELIHERWLAVKRHERRRKRMQAEDEEEELEHSPSGQMQPVASGATTLSCEAISHAKSQPNLNGRTASTVRSGQFGREMGAGIHSRECSNFILIYELNKSAGETQAATAAAAREEEEAKRRAQLEQANWCQRRITKIVDVRTLKRTLSLPECLIYSNDLLKRFNILKL